MFKSRRERKNSVSGKLIGALFGLGMFAGAFFLLWSNEGRVNYANIAQESIPASAQQTGFSNPGDLIALKGDLHTTETLSDPIFLENTSYIQLNRKVEMYAWAEKEVEEDEETYYEYSMEWTNSPENSDHFHDGSYVNPKMQYENISFTVSEAFIGKYGIDPHTIKFPEPVNLDLTMENIKDEIIRVNFVSLFNDYLYFGNDSLDSPEIGDLRISFTAVPQQEQVTAFGQVANQKLLPYNFEGDDSLYRLFFVDRENAIQIMDEEYTAALWGTRFAGFALLWCGMFLLLNPITILVTFLPILERAGNWLLVAITFPIAAIIAILLILVSYLAHNLLVLIGIILLSLLAIGATAGILYYLDKRKKNETI